MWKNLNISLVLLEIISIFGKGFTLIVIEISFFKPHISLTKHGRRPKLYRHRTDKLNWILECYFHTPLPAGRSFLLAVMDLYQTMWKKFEKFTRGNINFFNFSKNFLLCVIENWIFKRLLLRKSMVEKRFSIAACCSSMEIEVRY